MYAAPTPVLVCAQTSSAMSSPFRELLPGCRDDVFWREKPNLFCNSFSGAEAPKVFMPIFGRAAHISFPAERRRLLDGHPGFHLRRQHLLAILRVFAT